MVNIPPRHGENAHALLGGGTVPHWMCDGRGDVQIYHHNTGHSMSGDAPTHHQPPLPSAPQLTEEYGMSRLGGGAHNDSHLLPPPPVP